MKIALLGYGKLGRSIHEIIETDDSLSLNPKITSENARSFTAKDLAGSDVAIEVSTPESAVRNIQVCFEAGIPVVVGTTGWTSKTDEIKKECMDKNQSMIYASNFSVGMNILFELNRKLASIMNGLTDYRVSISETHHTEKKDSPSGTAVTLAENMIKELEEKENWVNKETPERNLIPVISQRIEDVFGIHTIKYGSAVESIELKHEAHSRKGFAQGAILAAKWLPGKKGFFTMRDVLKFD